MGLVRLSAPYHVASDRIQAFAADKLDWIRKQQQTIQSRDRPPPPQFVTGERHDFQGLAYDLEAIETTRARKVELADQTLHRYVRAGDPSDRRRQILSCWYRQQLRQILPLLINEINDQMMIDGRIRYRRANRGGSIADRVGWRAGCWVFWSSSRKIWR